MGKFSQYKIQLASLAEGVHEQDFLIDSAFFKNMEVTDIMSADVKVHLVLTKKPEAYNLMFRLMGNVVVPCDRCLDPMTIPIDTDYELNVKYGEEYSEEADNVLVIPYSDTSLNVAYMLKDTVQLCIPLRHVHDPRSCNRAMVAVLSKHGMQEEEEQADYRYSDSSNSEQSYEEEE